MYGRKLPDVAAAVHLLLEGQLNLGGSRNKQSSDFTTDIQLALNPNNRANSAKKKWQV